MKNNRYEKIHRVAAQLTVASAYPLVFHIAALVGDSNLHKPTSVGEMVFPLITCMIFLTLLVLTICTGLLKKHVNKIEQVDEVSGDAEADSEKESKDKQLEAIKRKRNKTKNWVVYTSLIIVSLLIRLPMIGTFQRWDAGEYFYTVGTSVQDYTFTLPNFLYNFAVAYHLNYGFTSFIAIPLFFSSRSVIAITLWQILFSVLAVMALYRIFRIVFSFTRSRSAVAALIIGNVPIFLGLTAYCTPDYYLVLFFIFALYFQAREWHILEVFMLLMMCFTKENAALVVLGYYGVRILCRFIFVSLSRARELKTFADKSYQIVKMDFDVPSEVDDEEISEDKEKKEKVDLRTGQLFAEKTMASSVFDADPDFDEICDEVDTGNEPKKNKNRVPIKQRIRLVTHTSDFWVALTVGLLFVIAMILKGATWADKVSATGVASTGLSFEKPYIYLKIKQYLGSNFAWLIFVYFLIAFKNTIIDRKWKNLKGSGWLMFGGMCGALAFFMAFGMFFHVSALERYNIFFAVGFAFITVAIMGVDIVNRSTYIFVGGVLATLLAIESFITIDPVTKGFYKQVPIGEKTMNFESEQIAYFGDGLVTNYQYAWLDKAFDKLLEDIDYNGDTALYFPIKETGVASGVQFEGNGAYFRVGWFDEKKKRDYFDYNMTGWSEMNICAISATDTWFPYAYVPYEKKINKQYMTNRAYICFVPYFEELGVNEDRHLQAISEYYYVGQKKKATSYRGTINYYPMVQQDGFIEGLSMGDVLSELKSLTANDEEIEVAAGETDAGEHDDNEVPVIEGVSSSSASKQIVYNDELLADRTERLINYRMAGFLKVGELNEAARIDIEPMDSVHLMVELYDANGKRIRTSHDEEECVVKVGVGELIDEIDEALQDMNAGEIREVEFVVPDGYPELEIYSGQKLTAKLQPLYIACRLAYVIDDEKKNELINDTTNEVKESYNREYTEYRMRTYIQKNADVLREVLESDSTNKAEDMKKALGVSEGTLSTVQNYYYQYLETISMTKEEFAENTLHATPEEYEEAMVIIARVLAQQ